MSNSSNDNIPGPQPQDLQMRSFGKSFASIGSKLQQVDPQFARVRKAVPQALPKSADEVAEKAEAPAPQKQQQQNGEAVGAAPAGQGVKGGKGKRGPKRQQHEEAAEGEAASAEEKKKAEPKEHEKGYAVVKAVPSGDQLVLLKEGGVEKQVTLSGIKTPRMAIRAMEVDEPFAWQCREFLRKKCIGKSVRYEVTFTPENSKRDYCNVFVDEENVAQEMVKAGWAQVKEAAIGRSGKPHPEREALQQLEESAKSLNLGLHALDVPREQMIRSVEALADAHAEKFVAKYKGVPIPAVVDYVRDGSTLRCELTQLGDGDASSLKHLTVLLALAGVQCPRMPLPAGVLNEQWERAKLINPAAPKPKAENPPAFAEEAKHFVEERLLHRDVQVVLHGLDKNGSVFGSILYPKGDIAERLLESGLAKTVEWTLNTVADPNKLRTALHTAQSKQLRLWKNFSGAAASESGAAVGEEGASEVKVLQVLSGDSMIVLDGQQHEKRIALSSIRAPRIKPASFKRGPEAEKDDPYAFEAKEFIRKRVIGHKVKMVVDYTRPAPADRKNAPPLLCVSLFINKMNVSEMLVADGLAEVVRHRGDDPRSPFYSALLDAELKAKVARLGIHSGMPAPNNDFLDLSERFGGRGAPADDKTDAKMRELSAKAKAMLKDFKQETQAIVEHVFSGSRVKLFLPKNRAMIAFALSGVKAPKAKEPFADVATNFTRYHCLQMQVTINIETIDKGDNYIGSIILPGSRQSLGVALVQEGLASVFGPSADRMPEAQGKELYEAEAAAKAAKKNIWKNYVEKPATPVNASTVPLDRRPESMVGQTLSMSVTEIIDGVTVFVHVLGDPVIEQVKAGMAAFGANVPAAPAGWVPNRNAVVAGFYGDGLWHRVKVESVEGNAVNVFFLDFGNHDQLELESVRPLPKELTTPPPAARECVLAGLKTVSLENEFAEGCMTALHGLVWDRVLDVKVVATDKQGRPALLISPEAPQSVNQQLVAAGWAGLCKSSDKTVQALLHAWDNAQTNAKHAHTNVWAYGDWPEDEEDVVEEFSRKPAGAAKGKSAANKK